MFYMSLVLTIVLHKITVKNRLATPYRKHWSDTMVSGLFKFYIESFLRLCEK